MNPVSVLFRSQPLRITLLLALGACGGEENSQTPTAPTPAPPVIGTPPGEAVAAAEPTVTVSGAGAVGASRETPPAEVAPPEVTPAEVAPSEITAPAAPGLAPPSNGLPAFTRGAPILLRSLRVEERHVGTVDLPTVAITDAASRARLDELIAEAGSDTLGCEIPLATETFVSLRCLADRSNTGRGLHGGDRILHFRVGAAGDVEAIPFLSFFHPGLEEEELTGLLLHTPAAQHHYAVFTARGLELNSRNNVVAEPAMLPYRAIAPYLRADSPLGAILLERDLTLAAVDTQMPPLPEHAYGVWATSIDYMPAVINGWSLLPADLQGQVRLVTPYGDNAAGLIFPPSIDAARAGMLSAQFRNLGSLFTRESYWTAAGSEISWMRTRDVTEVHERPDGSSDVVGRLPPNTFLPTVTGHINVAASNPARGWAYVGQSPQRRGWVRSNSLTSAGECVPPNHELQGLQVVLRGTNGWRAGDLASPIAWYVSKYQARLGYQLEIAPLNGCSIGTPRVIEMRAEPSGLYFASSTAGGAPDLLIVLHGRAATIYGAQGEGPIFSATLGPTQTVEVGVETGPSGETGYYPIRLGTAPQPTWLAWTGTTLEPRTP